MMDDPTPGGRRDGMDPGEEDRVPDADRYHGGVKDPAHPDFFTVEHRALPSDEDLLGQPERNLVVDDHDSRTAGPGARTQADLGRPANPGEADADAPGDPRRRRPNAEPDAT